MEQLKFTREKIPHAILLENPPADYAIKIAKNVICMSENAPCGICSHCIKMQAGSHPDVKTFKKGENVDKYNIEFIRNLCDDAYLLSNEGGRKIYIIYNADDLSVQCQNALLKSIEEQPKDVYFILCCNSKEKLLETVISRCTALAFNDDETPSDELYLQALDIVESAILPDELTLLQKLVPFNSYDSLKRLCDAMLFVLQKVYTMRILPEKCEPDERLQQIVRKVSLPSIIRMTDAVRQFAIRVNANGNIALICTVFCADIKRALFK